MGFTQSLDAFHARAKQNRWLRYFAVFNRIILAIGFIPPGITKIIGERFTDLNNNHPMGHYLEALHHTGYYYTSLGVLQVLAGVLLLIPRTVTLGAMIYFPIILNICILTFAVRFDGSLFTAPLMTLSCLFLLCWNYDKIKYILPFKHSTPTDVLVASQPLRNKFPRAFFIGVFFTMVFIVFGTTNMYDIMPKNRIPFCLEQFEGTNRTHAGQAFCECVHTDGNPLDGCMETYFEAPDDPVIDHQAE